MENNTIQAIQEQYKDCNLLMPTSTEAQLNPFYKLTVQSVQADVSEHSGDIFSLGKQNRGGEWIELFSPAKPLLMKLATAAGIQFDPNNTYGQFLGKNCYKAKAFGAVRLPDGTSKTHCDEKVINLDDEEDKFRLEFMDKSIQGIIEPRAAKEAEKMFPGGEWVDATDKNDKRCKAYKVAEKDRQAYIDRTVLVNMTLLRKTFAEKAMTGAILRVIRALIGLKGMYTMAELKKPFAVSKVTFSPDYNDPEVRRATLSMGMNSMGNMFGTANIPVIGTGESKRDVIDTPFNPEEYKENSAFVSESLDEPDFVVSDDKWDDSQKENTDEAPIGFFCSGCGVKITEAVHNYSSKSFGRSLCMSCQKGGR